MSKTTRGNIWVVRIPTDTALRNRNFTRESAYAANTASTIANNTVPIEFITLFMKNIDTLIEPWSSSR
ncbi:hypothetical protein ES708_27702 [subsurface metagenome]